MSHDVQGREAAYSAPNCARSNAFSELMRASRNGNTRAATPAHDRKATPHPSALTSIRGSSGGERRLKCRHPARGRRDEERGRSPNDHPQPRALHRRHIGNRSSLRLCRPVCRVIARSPPPPCPGLRERSGEGRFEPAAIKKGAAPSPPPVGAREDDRMR
jgi:hypothetical protein